MLELTKEEKIILLFLSLALATGLAAGYVKKTFFADKYSRTSCDFATSEYFRQEVAFSKQVNINTAGAAELQTLQGIGEVLARRIIDYRLENGPFCSKEELLKVKGIGEKKYDKIKDSVQLN